MIQLQTLNYIISKKDEDLLITYDQSYFFNYTDEYNFIIDHFRNYKIIPDLASVLDKFPDFNILEVNESKDYIEHKLYEEYVYNESVKIIQQSTKDFSIDATRAVDELRTKLTNIKPPVKKVGTNIIQQSQDRYDKMIDRMANRDNHIFSTGLNELDMTIDGMQRGEELMIIFARTNNCKSWIAEKLAVSVWEAGHNVGFFSPEMSDLSVGYRFDTLHKNFDNKGIQGSIPDYESGPYKNYLKKLTTNKNVFSVTTPLDFNKIVTVSAIKKWIVDQNLKMIVIDGITYMTNERCMSKSQNTTEKLTEIAEDLMTLSTELGVPIIAVVQANRSAARDKDGEVSEDAPELDTIRGSDGISHNASKVISVVHRKDTITLYINKNRSGPVNNKLVYQYDVNTGNFTYIDNPKSGLALPPTQEEDTRNLYADSEDAL